MSIWVSCIRKTTINSNLRCISHSNLFNHEWIYLSKASSLRTFTIIIHIYATSHTICEYAYGTYVRLIMSEINSPIAISLRYLYQWKIVNLECINTIFLPLHISEGSRTCISQMPIYNVCIQYIYAIYNMHIYICSIYIFICVVMYRIRCMRVCAYV